MTTTQSKLKFSHIVLIVIMGGLSVALFMYKDKILPNPNAAYEELYSTFKKAEGTIVSMESRGGRRSVIIYTIQFYDQNNNLITVTKNNWQTMPLKKDDKVIMYYNPLNPQEATPESSWKEIMRK
ncbi:hypothetical protein D0T51_03160 [Parabacteroides sp. 52]|uniref:hypothetical protein n=1 Tax=unclassified Parabacteroides TaxID=2649774 RepID=UPI0013D6D234|nr:MULTISPECIES: hypothetical protein [unclassified Parabacteroides]MDH6533993.1 hypothetical protein [Parabacteroides sp. PM5-20]NDV54734.1 hypothetical protein [Parabacteroides sp. 52]